MRHVWILMLLMFPCICWSQEQETQAGRGKAAGIFKDYTTGKFTDVSKGLEEYRSRYGDNSIYYFLNHLYTKESASPAFSLEVSYNSAVTSIRGYNKIDPKDSETLCKKIGFCQENLKQGIDELHLRLFIKMRESEEGLTKLIDTYPESPYRIKARSMRDSIRYRTAVAGDTPESYRHFIMNNPGAQQYSEARWRQAALTWTRIMAFGNANDYKSFLSDFNEAPGYMRESVSRKLRELKHDKIQEDYRNFIKRYRPLLKALPEMESGRKINVSGSVEYAGERMEGATVKLGSETYKPYQDIKPLIKSIAEFEGEAMGTESMALEELVSDLYRLEERVDFTMIDQLQQGKRGYNAFIKKHNQSAFAVVAASRIKVIDAEEKWAEEERIRQAEEARRLAELRRQKEEAERKEREAKEAAAKKEQETMARLEKTVLYQMAKKLSTEDLQLFVEVAKGNIHPDPDGQRNQYCGSFDRKCEWCGNIFESKKYYSSRVTDLSNSIWNPFTNTIMIYGSVYTEIMNYYAAALGQALTGQKPKVELTKEKLTEKQLEFMEQMTASLKNDLSYIRENDIYYCPINNDDKYCSKKCKYEHELAGKN